MTNIDQDTELVRDELGDWHGTQTAGHLALNRILLAYEQLRVSNQAQYEAANRKDARIADLEQLLRAAEDDKGRWFEKCREQSFQLIESQEREKEARDYQDEKYDEQVARIAELEAVLWEQKEVTR